MQKWGTSSAVVAAFVGPGTVLTAATSGLTFGYSLGWVLLFATASAFILQSLTAGTGILAQQGLGEALAATIAQPAARILTYTLVILGLWIGCASFELGNLMGAAVGLQTLFGDELSTRWLVLALGAAAAVLLLLDVRILLKVLASLVAVMGLLFLATAAVAPIDWGAAMHGLMVPTVTEGGLLHVVALIGTTIVTYNLFLHPALAKVYWHDAPDRRVAWRRELVGMAIFLPLGGLISWAILLAGATLTDGSAHASSVGDVAELLTPVAGSAGRVLFGLGLLAAGLTSAVTAPLAAAAGIRELFDWPTDRTDVRYRMVWGSVVLAGVAFGLSGVSPLKAIVAAQAANGLLLPVLAGFVLYLTARQTHQQMPTWYLGLGGLVTAICAILGVRTLLWAASQF
ncbi:MAG: Nramp family divalent metal transporter [Rhodothermales bacterium]